MGIVINLAEVRLLRERQRMWRELKKYVQEHHEQILFGVNLPPSIVFGFDPGKDIDDPHKGETHDDTDGPVAG